jgi:hypothetical protein
MREARNTHKILEKVYLGELKMYWRVICIKLDLREINSENVIWIEMSQVRV